MDGVGRGASFWLKICEGYLTAAQNSGKSGKYLYQHIVFVCKYGFSSRRFVVDNLPTLEEKK